MELSAGKQTCVLTVPLLLQGHLAACVAISSHVPFSVLCVML